MKRDLVGWKVVVRGEETFVIEAADWEEVRERGS
jgi:hypothetical protein